jgi:putative ABC transport system permease protein
VQNNLSTSSVTYIYIFAGIAFLILLIANINFINMAVAQSVVRTKEIGMRKILGAARGQLIIQFLGESLMVTFAGFILAFIIALFALPLLNQLTGKQLSWQLLFRTSNLLLFVATFLVSGILAGLYPAFFISRFRTAISLKGKSGEKGQRNTARKVLLVAQFAICTALIVGSIVVYQQLQFMRNKPLGFQKSQMIIVPIFGSNASVISNGVDVSIRQRMNSFSNELMNNSRIKFVTAVSALPGQNIVNGLVIPQGFTDNSNVFVPWISVDYNFLQTFHIPLVAGRSFSKATGTDHLSAFIINESAMHAFNWKDPQDAIGKNITRGEAATGKKGQIIGVIKDFNLTTLDQPFQPLVLDVNAPRFTEFAINVQPDHLPTTISLIEKTWNKFFPGRVFEYNFLDKELDRLYTDKERLSRLIGYFAVIAIALSCMGLFSVATFLSILRAREIGIRKVLGATVSSILVLLSREFLALILVSFVIAIPLSWWAMNEWLQGFAFRIHISWLVFAATGLFVFLMAVLTMSFQSIRAATVNPVRTLRSE